MTNGHQAFAPAVRDLVRADTRRVIIVGARGWIGRVTLDLLSNALGQAVDRRVVAFGSSDAMLTLASGATLQQRALDELHKLPPAPSLLLHLAFLTKDKVGQMAETDYVDANRALSAKVFKACDQVGVDRLFIASSGAAARAEDPNAKADMRLYGRLKRDDEEAAARWTEARPGRQAAIGRIFSVSGPYINKHETYALASFIRAARTAELIRVLAPRRVYRSYVAIRELMSVVFALLLNAQEERVIRFETGGAALELETVAQTVAEICGGSVTRAAINEQDDDHYVGDDAAWQRLLARFDLRHVPLAEQVAETAQGMAVA